MAFTPLTGSQADQTALHIDQLAVQLRIDEGDPTIPAAFMADRGLRHYEERAGGFPSTGRNIGVQEGLTLSISEANQVAANVNALTALVEHDGANASDVANEVLALIEEVDFGIPETGRDVTQEQLP